MLIYGTARDGWGARPVGDIHQLSRAEWAWPGKPSEQRCRGGRGIGGVGFFFPGNEGLAAFHPTVLHLTCQAAGCI